MNGLVAAAAVVASALLTLCGVVYTQRQVRKAGEKQVELDRTKVDAEAYRRAQVIESNAREALEGLLSTVQAELREVRKQLNAERRVSDALRVHVRKLEETIDALVRLLRQQGIVVPETLTTLPPVDDDLDDDVADSDDDTAV